MTVQRFFIFFVIGLSVLVSAVATRASEGKHELWGHFVVEVAQEQGLKVSGDMESYRLSDGKILLRGQFDDYSHYRDSRDKLAKNTGIVRFSSDLLQLDHGATYLAKQHRLSAEQRRYVKVQRLYVKNGFSKDISALMSRYKEAFAQHNVQRDVFIFAGATGRDLPYIDIVRFARDKNDDLAYEDTVNKAFGKALLTELSQAFGQYIRKADAGLEGSVI